MAGLMYFVPGKAGQLTTAALAELGLGHAFDVNPYCREARGETPSGTPGLVVGERRRMGDRAVKLMPAEQTWHRLPGLEAYVGWYTDDPPAAADLVRPQALTGVAAMFADGQEWVIPVARAADEEGECVCRLPARYTLDDEGRLIAGEVVERYRRLWEITEPYWYAMINDEEVSDQACLEDAGEVLAVNYYLGWREAALVGMFSTELGPGALLAVACGYFTWLRWRESKKNSPSPSSSTETDSSSSAGEAA